MIALNFHRVGSGASLAHLRCMSTRNTRSNLSESLVDLPLASIHVNERGVMRVAYDGGDFPPLHPDAPWSRAGFGDLLDAISDHRTRTIRVEVHEFDGSVFTDIVHVARREQAITDVQSPRTIRRARHRPTNQLIEVTGSGFIPGEDVTVALPVPRAEGSDGGSARAVIDMSQLVDHQSEILLIGRISDVIVTESLPS